MANEIYVNTAADMHALVGTLMAEGWYGSFKISPPNGDVHPYAVDLAKGSQGIQLQLGGMVKDPFVAVPAVLVPMNSREKFLQYTAAEFEELQAMFAGG